MTYFDRDNITEQVREYLEGWTMYYDVPGIVDELSEYTAEDGGHIQSIDDVDPDDFKDILQRHDMTEE